jgi:hypothetical protein
MHRLDHLVGPDIGDIGRGLDRVVGDAAPTENRDPDHHHTLRSCCPHDRARMQAAFRGGRSVIDGTWSRRAKISEW